MTRGVLIDVAALKGVEMLPDTYEITVADLQQALARQQLTLQPGDAVIVHTGWGRLWGKENGRYMKTNPGLGAAAAEWLARQDPMLIGADNAPINVTPSPDPQLSNPVHQIMLVVNGVFLLENLQARRARRSARVRVRADRRAAQARRRHGVDGCADCDPMKELQVTIRRTSA